MQENIVFESTLLFLNVFFADAFHSSDLGVCVCSFIKVVCILSYAPHLGGKTV
jgi:hypothetical protein